ncbi:MAG: hypothetical protein KJI71_00555 [Patescibacteria group bacterium]|nr:hypothetical protein [Patescibacteria group bacterium]
MSSSKVIESVINPLMASYVHKINGCFTLLKRKRFKKLMVGKSKEIVINNQQKIRMVEHILDKMIESFDNLVIAVADMNNTIDKFKF